MPAAPGLGTGRRQSARLSAQTSLREPKRQREGYEWREGWSSSETAAAGSPHNDRKPEPGHNGQNHDRQNLRDKPEPDPDPDQGEGGSGNTMLFDEEPFVFG